MPSNPRKYATSFFTHDEADVVQPAAGFWKSVCKGDLVINQIGGNIARLIRWKDEE